MIYVLKINPHNSISKEMLRACKSSFSQKVMVAFCKSKNTDDTGVSNAKYLIKLIVRRLLCLMPGYVMLDRVQIGDEDKFVCDYSDAGERNIILDEAIEKKISQFYIYSGENGLMRLDQSKPELNYMEYHVTWHCNLKCKGCGHYSNLQATPMFSDLNQYEKDLSQLHRFVRNISCIRLMGGEPLLNPDLKKFIEVTRKEFPFAHIAVASNGLLIPSCDDTLLVLMNKLKIRFDITCYPPTAKILDRIKDRCREFEVELLVSDPVTEFFACSDGSEISDAKGNWNDCESKLNHFLYNGKLAVCGLPILVDVMHEKAQYKGTVSTEDVVDIFESNLTSEKLIEKMNSPITMCKYCDKSNKSFYKWEGQYTQFFSSQMLNNQRKKERSQVDVGL